MAYAADEDAAEGRSADLLLRAQHAEVVSTAPTSVPLGRRRSIGLHVEEPDVPAAATLPLSRAATQDVDGRTGRRQADAAREEQIDRLRLAELERGGVLEEERTLFREEQVEPRQVDLLLVGLDLREVGVDRGIERRDSAECPTSRPRPRSRGRSTLVGRAREVLVGRAQRVGNQLSDRGALPQGDARDLGGQRDAVDVEPARNRRQVHLLVLVPDVPQHVEAPGAVRAHRRSARSSAESPSRLPSRVRSPAPCTDPVAVPVRIERADAAALRAAGAAAGLRQAARLPLPRHLAVVLDAEGVGAEHERVLVVVERVEDQDDRVGVGQRGVTPRLRRR